MKKKLPFTLAEAEKWLKKYPTPFYVYDKAGIEKCIGDLQKAFAWNKGYKEYFAVKACPNPSVLRLLSSLGCGTDCASCAEVIMSTKCGIDGKNIMFTSNETLPEEYITANNAGAIINLDDITQIENMQKAVGVPDTVCCRYNPGKFQISNDIMGHLYDSKFGMTKEQLFEAFAKLKKLGVSRLGVHAMLASCSLDNSYYPALARELFTLVLEVKEKTGITLDFVDMAGGIGIPYRPEETAVDIAKIGADVHSVYDEILTPEGISLSIFTEMGRYVTGPYGYLLTSVVGKKHIYKEYIGVDATASCLMRPAIYGSYHHLTVLGKEEAEEKNTFDVVGSLCENNDKFAVDRKLPDIEIGDIIAIHDAGAHGHAMGYTYNGKLRPAEFMLENGEITMIRRAQTIDDYFATFDIDKDFCGGNNND